MKQRPLRWGLVFFAPWALAGWVFFKSQASEYLFRDDDATRLWVLSEVSAQARKGHYPAELALEGDAAESVSLTYTFDPQLQREAERQLQAYKPDFGAIVVIDAPTGRIRAMASFERTPQFQENLALRASFPAASIFKMVTAAAAVDQRKANPGSPIRYNGGNHTLYRRNVLNEQVNRWTRTVTLRDAFARSLNTAFGRLAIERIELGELEEYARRFGFNRVIPGHLKFDAGFAEFPSEPGYELAEVASGFNRTTRMSPLQGALMAAAVANEGWMPQPQIIASALGHEGRVLMEAEPEPDLQVLSAAGVAAMKELMEATITNGTSRKSFRPLRRDRRLKDLEVGGKTGSLTGTEPRGKTDWFVGYAKSERGEKLAIAAVTVHIDRWRVKSSDLAQILVRSHFRNHSSWVARNP